MAAANTNGAFSPYERRSPVTPASTSKAPRLVDQFGKVIPPTNDPAWQPPRDALGPNPKASAGIIHREIPLTAIQTSWGVGDVRNALSDLSIGLFDQAAQLVDAIVGDDRVQATLGSRCGALFGRPVKFEPSRIARVKGSKAAEECCEAWREAWAESMTENVFSELQTWALMLGFGPAQVLWDTSRPVWVPHVRPWHPRFTYYHWTLRCYVAQTLDGIVPITPGDGHWILHAPYGEYRGWMRGAVRALAQPWLIRALAYRDWARYSERHGFPIVKAKTPAAGDPTQANNFRMAMTTLGQESVVELPQGVEEQFSYDIELMEASDTAWEGFAQLIDRCEMSIVLTLMHQNLTTEVKEGSFAAARIHGDVKQEAVAFDARGSVHTVQRQLARPFAAINFGDADLAPHTYWDIEPYEDDETVAKTFGSVIDGVLKLRQAGYKVTDIEALAKSFGIDLTRAKLEAVEPILAGGAPKEASNAAP